MPRTCVVLLSGGLDSLLALRLMVAQGLRAIALHTVNTFARPAGGGEAKKTRLARQAEELGAIETVFVDISKDVIELVKHPNHGYGRHMNPCIDCRLASLAAGAATMRRAGADFIVTGEVVGQRPMSQRRDAIALAERMTSEWGMAGRVLRPLTARVLPASVPEREGWVDRELLFDITGRGRERQIALAARLGVADYPSPAGGCLLTDPGYAQRLAALATCKPSWDEDDAELLKVGRAFVITAGARVAVGRNEEENELLAGLAKPTDRLYANAGAAGATVLLRGEVTPETESAAGGLALYYSRSRGAGAGTVRRWRMENGQSAEEGTFPATEADPDSARAAAAELTGPDCLQRLRGSGRRAGCVKTSNKD